ncbi:MAG: helix-turn-helix transcriptional regulator [Clostridium sp.]
MVKCKINILMAEKRMSQKELSQLTGIRPNTISGYYNDTFKLVDRRHINEFCKVFKCTISDLFEYTLDKTE